MDDAKEVSGIFHGSYKVAVELVCSAVDSYVKSEGQSQEYADIVLLELAKAIKMQPEGRAARFLDHFLFGNGDSIEFDCATLIREDRGVRQRVMSAISRRLAGSPSLAARNMSGGAFVIPIRQKDYELPDWQLALGSFAIEWDAVESQQNVGRGPLCSSALGRDWMDSGTLALTRNVPPCARHEAPSLPTKLKIYGANEYKWHPAAPRVTQCLHQAGDRLTKSRVKSMNFWMIARPCVIDLSTGLPSW